METLKKYVLNHFEKAFILLIMVSVSLITHYLPYKLAFLNFFYIPVLLAAYYLGSRFALLGSIFTVLLVTIYAYQYPQLFAIELTFLDLLASITAWGSFLLLSGITVGKLNSRLKQKTLEARRATSELQNKEHILEQTSQELDQFVINLDSKVKERTERLEKTNQSVELHKQKVEDALYATMDPTVVRLLIEKRLRIEKRRISVQFCDLKGFTEYSEERQAEMVVTDLNLFLSDMENILLNYHAHIDKYMGDGIMAEFGAPIDYERYALHAICASWKMQEHMTRQNFPWKMRIGIATGDAIIGLIGHKRQTYTALGDTVNLAARIETMCIPGAITVDENTYNDVKHFFDFTRKTVFTVDHIKDTELSQRISRNMMAVEKSPDNIELLKQTAKLLLQGNDLALAKDYFKQAMRIDPNDNESKLAYADISLQLSAISNVPIKGRKQSIHLYEITNISDPLLDRDKIPQQLYDKYYDVVKKSIPYPEDLLLPVECIEAAIGHSKVVGFLAYALADHLGMDDKDKQDILEAGYLADIGKTIIPHHLLNRRGSLSDDEFSEVQKHPRESVRQLKQMGYRNNEIFNIIEHHHEKYTGGGYPKGISGDDIPFGSRIVAVAEAYSSLTSWRPYREKWQRTAAYKAFTNDSERGKFDPVVIDALGEILGENSTKATVVGL